MRTLFAILLLVACDDENLAGVGQPCSSSGECAAGLLCDFGRKPHSCQPAGSVRTDFSVPSNEDLSGVEPMDLAGSHD